MYINFLIKIKNASAAGKNFLKSSYSKMNFRLAEILRNYGFLKKIEVKGRSPKKTIEVELNPNRKIEGLRFLSKPSRHLYIGYRELKPSKGNRGIVVVSTPKGVMEAREAKKQKVGGELLFEIW
jgi:small subunit ribosomal protein S8